MMFTAYGGDSRREMYAGKAEPSSPLVPLFKCIPCVPAVKDRICFRVMSEVCCITAPVMFVNESSECVVG